MSYSTEERTKLIESDPNVIQTLTFSPQPLNVYLQSCADRKRITKSQVVKRTGLSKSYVYDVMSGKRIPSRDTVIKIALALELNLNETQRALKLAKKNELYSQEQRDAILMACVNRRFTILDANEELLRYCEDSLFTEELENDNG